MQHLWIYTVKPCVLIVDKCDELSTLIPSIQEEFEDTKGVIRIEKGQTTQWPKEQVSVHLAEGF
jgi:hypothetical protein